MRFCQSNFRRGNSENMPEIFTSCEDVFKVDTSSGENMEYSSIKTDHAFDSRLVRRFCKKNNVPAGTLFHAVWAVVVSTYLDTEEVSWKCQTTNGAVNALASYRGRVEGSKTFMQVLGTIGEFEPDESPSIEPAPKQRRQEAWQALLFDACLSMGTRKEDNTCPSVKTIQKVLRPMPFYFPFCLGAY